MSIGRGVSVAPTWNRFHPWGRSPGCGVGTVNLWSAATGPAFPRAVSRGEPQPNPRSDVHGRVSVAIEAAGGRPPPVALASPSSNAAMTKQSTQAPATSRTFGAEW